MRSNIVNTICETSMASLSEAIEAQDIKLIKLRDGNSPTPQQIQWLMQAGKEDFEAAADLLDQRTVRTQNAAWASQRAFDIIQKYDPQPGETMQEIMPRMSVDDSTEIMSLITVAESSIGVGHES